MKQNEVVTLPVPRILPPNAEPDVQLPAQANNAPVESASPGTGKPDLLVPVQESMPAPRGDAMRKAMFDLLGDNVEKQPEPEAVLDDKPNRSRPRRGIKARILPLWQLWEGDKQADCEHDRKILSSEPGVPSCLLMLPESALVACISLPDKVGVDPKDKSDRSLQPDTGFCDSEVPWESGDRLHRVAVVAHTVTHEPRPPKLTRPGSLPALRPASKAECERRCGSDGFCDPSHPLGCGGLHCGKQRDLLD